MRIAVIGAGPAGLFFAAEVRRLRPDCSVTVWERRPDGSTFGFGVVFSDDTLSWLREADQEFSERLLRECARWDRIDVRHRGEVISSGGHGFAAIDRRRLLALLAGRCHSAGTDPAHGAPAPDLATLRREYDLVVAADGSGSAVRHALRAELGVTERTGRCRYVWLGTDRVFDAFVFDVRETGAGVVQLHGYPYAASASTVIVEATEETWRGLGIAADAGTMADADPAVAHLLRTLFPEVFTGHGIRVDGARFTAFTTVTCARWSVGNVVLLGDAAHTAHFSIGSGTKMALEDARALATTVADAPDVPTALASYAERRMPAVASVQRSAAASMAWFESTAHYVGQPSTQFAVNILTRSRRVTYENLWLRDPKFAETARRWFAETAAEHRADGTVDPDCPPMFQPFRLGELRLANRVVVSAMDMYSATDGVPGDFHLVHLGSKALGGAGLVMTEMTCVSPAGRITPACAGLYTDDQERAWARITAFVHDNSPAAIGLQLGHSGRKGSKHVMWEGGDRPLETGGWTVEAPSPLPYCPGDPVPVELTVERMAEIAEEFVAAARRGARAGFDLLELHCAHGYLLSSFLSPLANRRRDRYGGSLANRLRYPLEVFDAVRAVWPERRPMIVRISATDWFPGGMDIDDAVTVARAFLAHGADALDVSTGQVVAEEEPAFGRSYQTPFADRIRNEAGIPTIAVGAISSFDDVNSLLLAGRADLCALGRTHLYDPQWTLHAAAEQEYAGVPWPVQYQPGARRPRTAAEGGR